MDNTPSAAAAGLIVPPVITPASSHTPLVTDPRRRLIVFLILLTGMFMATLDNQIVATALPTIVGEFGQLERFGWVGSAYLLAASTVMPVYGKLGDLFGRKYVMMAAIFIFTVGSLVCGLAVSMNTLIAARVVQAIGGGGIMVSIFSINADLFEPRERARYQSYASLVLMLSGAVGPVLGGVMSDLFGWRSIFLVNLPIGIGVLVGLAFLLPYKRPVRKPKIDYAGAALLAGAIASIVLWADSSELFGGLLTMKSLAIIAFGLACLAGWIWVEKRVAEPVVPLTLFSNPTVSLLLFISLISGAIGIGLVNYYALYLQSGLGMSPTMAGLFFIPLTGGIALGSLTSGRLMSLTGRYKVFSVASTAIGLLTLASYQFIGSATPLVLVATLMLIQGIGIGINQQVPVLGVQNAAHRADTGAATGVVTLTRMGGASIGISIYGAIIAAGVARSTIVVPGVSDIKKLAPAAVAVLPPETQQLIAQVYQHAFQPLFITAAFISFLGLIAAVSLKNIQLPVKHGGG